MPQPDVRGSYVPSVLQTASIQYRNAAYVARDAFPTIERFKPKMKIGKYNKGAWFRDEAGIRAPGAVAPRGGWVTSFLSVSLTEYAFAHSVTDEDRRDNDGIGAMPMNPDVEAIQFCADKIDMKFERLVKAAVAGTTWLDGVSGGEDAEGLWAQGAGNTFLEDMAKAKKAVLASTGFVPNRLLIDYVTFLGLCRESTLLSAVQYTERGILTAPMIAAIAGIEKVIVAPASYSTAKEKKDGTDYTAAAIWEITAGGHGMGFVYYVPDTPSKNTPSALYLCRGVYEDGQPRRVTKWREEANHQDVYEVAEENAVCVCGADCGYLFKDTALT